MLIHRAANGVDVGLDHVLRPRGVDAQHRGEAVAVLPGDPQRIFASHQVPAHRRMARDVRPPIPQLQRREGRAPSSGLNLQVSEGLARFAEEDVVVSDDTGSLKSGAKRELTLENDQRSWAEGNPPVVAGLGSIAVNTGDSRFVDADNSVHQVDIGEHERNLFQRPHSGEETELVVVSLRFSPVTVNRSDERFGILHAERIDSRAVGLSQARATEDYGLGCVAQDGLVPKVKCASQNTDHIVVRLFAPGSGIRNLN
jgi:hypothetical protein